MSSPVRTPSRRVGSSGASAAFPGLIVNLTRRLVLSTMAISLVVSPPRLRPIACLSGDSSGGQPLFCASAVLVDLGKCPVHHNGLQVELLLDHVEDSLENAGLRPAPVAPVFQFPNSLGRSRQGAPVRVIQIIPFSDIRLLLPLRPGVPGLPGKAGSISRHCLSVRVSLASNPVPPHNTSLRYCKLYSAFRTLPVESKSLLETLLSPARQAKVAVCAFDDSWPAFTESGWRRVDRQINLKMENPIRRSTRTESLYLSWEVGTDAASQSNVHRP